MAISVNATVTTEEGFEVTNLYGWVDTYVLQSNWANMSYYKSKQDFIDGKSPLNVASLPSRVATTCLLYTSPSPRDGLLSRMPSSA